MRLDALYVTHLIGSVHRIRPSVFTDDIFDNVRKNEETSILSIRKRACEMRISKKINYRKYTKQSNSGKKNFSSHLDTLMNKFQSLTQKK